MPAVELRVDAVAGEFACQAVNNRCHVSLAAGLKDGAERLRTLRRARRRVRPAVGQTGWALVLTSTSQSLIKKTAHHYHGIHRVNHCRRAVISGLSEQPPRAVCLRSRCGTQGLSEQPPVLRAQRTRRAPG